MYMLNHMWYSVHVEALEKRIAAKLFTDSFLDKRMVRMKLTTQSGRTWHLQRHGRGFDSQKKHS